MATAKVLFERMIRLNDKIRETEKLLNQKIEKKLGYGWGVVQQTDGICLIDEDANNYLVCPSEFANLMRLDRDSAIAILEKHPRM